MIRTVDKENGPIYDKNSEDFLESKSSIVHDYLRPIILGEDPDRKESFLSEKENKISFNTYSKDSDAFTESFPGGNIEGGELESVYGVDYWSQPKSQKCFITIVLLIFECGLIGSVSFLVLGIWSKKYLHALHSILGTALVN
ncbi:uncharacterized protein LOC123293026 [Chrysoperla carnea]|uniref:uncharacterized protein LOC123293026 n=1 Tax=Chrysoperla carnea TaxID=189513 RepID=UPI001D07B91A|nr:uncharacterized protein LOC123293026 [Chrysoperla carnea]